MESKSQDFCDTLEGMRGEDTTIVVMIGYKTTGAHPLKRC